MVVRVDTVGALIHRVGKFSPALAADMHWRRSRRSDFALGPIDALVAPNITVVDIGGAVGSSRDVWPSWSVAVVAYTPSRRIPCT